MSRDRASDVEAEEAELIEAVARGEEDALAELYDRHAAGVLASARRAAGDSRRAEAVTEDVFVALWDAPESATNGYGSVHAFLAAETRRRSGDRSGLEDRRRPSPDGPGPRREILTHFERQAIELALEGATYREIAVVLDVAPKVAAAWLSSALDKIGWGP